MPELTIPQLAGLSQRDYINEVKTRLRDDNTFAVMLDPILVERTRWALGRMIESIDEQVARAEDAGTAVDPWISRITSLRRYTKERLDRLAPISLNAASTTKEIRAWKTFSARLAAELAEIDPVALERVKTPYGGLTASQWLSTREERSA